MKEDEKIFMLWMLYEDSKNGVIKTFNFPFSVHRKRNWYLLEKWCDRDYIECGTSINFVWLTDEGRKFLKKLLKKIIICVKVTDKETCYFKSFSCYREVTDEESAL